jgi:serine protease inhibitor
MNRTKRLYILGVIMIIAMGGVGVILNNLSPSLAYAESDTKAVNVNKSIVAANTGFALRLLTELQREQAGKNIFISPLSVSIALAMTYNGANSSTRDAMGSALGLQDDAVNSGYSDLIESLSSADSDVSLNIGDSVWIRSGFTPAVSPTFTDTLRKYYGSGVYSRPFDSSTVDEVNSWVDKKTRGKINKILDQIDSDNVMFLINAIYFKGGWIDEFDESATRPVYFNTADARADDAVTGSIVKVDMMNNNGSFYYYGDDDVKIARLPYGRDKIAMYVFLPVEDSTLGSLMAGLNEEKLNAYFPKLSKTELELQLPKLKLEYGKVDLKAALTNLGMGIAFDRDTADFGRIADVRPERLYIAFVDHKAVVEVNEEGTEAAAVTNVGISITSIPTRTPFVVDRPYMFVIRDDRSGTILFEGLIRDPTQQTSP